MVKCFEANMVEISWILILGFGLGVAAFIPSSLLIYIQTKNYTTFMKNMVWEESKPANRREIKIANNSILNDDVHNSDIENSILGNSKEEDEMMSPPKPFKKRDDPNPRRIELFRAVRKNKKEENIEDGSILKDRSMNLISRAQTEDEVSISTQRNESEIGLRGSRLQKSRFVQKEVRSPPRKRELVQKNSLGIRTVFFVVSLIVLVIISTAFLLI